jgi:hypothetical protein
LLSLRQAEMAPHWPSANAKSAPTIYTLLVSHADDIRNCPKN